MSDHELDPDYELTDEDTRRIMARYELDQLQRGHLPPSYEVAEMESRRWLAENLPKAGWR